MFLLTIALAAPLVSAHGYVKWIGVDNKLYPGFNPHVDVKLGAKRIAFGQEYTNHPRYAPSDVLLPDITCGRAPITPQLQAVARAGSDLTFGHSTWPITHNGPILTYMARYDGDVGRVNISELEFFKIKEAGLLPDRVTWATNLLTANDNVTSATIPHDIRPGNYVVRHEIITLHFATEDSRYMDSGSKTKGAQHFISCFNVRVTGSGTATPAGVRFPGGYRPRDAGLYFDVYRNLTSYPIPGPRPHVAAGAAPALPPNPYEVFMPMGNLVDDMKYFNNMYVQAWKWDGQTFKRNADSVNGKPDGPNPAVSERCTVERPCKEDVGGSNPSYGV